MNKVIEIGRLTRDPDCRVAQNGTKVARYTLAVDRIGAKDGQQSADFINCVTFGKGAEFAEFHLHKGIKIAIEGRIQTGSYKDKDGKTVYTTDVLVTNHEFCEPKSSSGVSSSDSSHSKENSQDDGLDGFMNIPDGIDEELPFS